MPCYDNRDYDGYQSGYEDGRRSVTNREKYLQDRNDKLARMLCYLTSRLEDNEFARLKDYDDGSKEFKELEEWWKEHKSLDNTRAKAQTKKKEKGKRKKK